MLIPGARPVDPFAGFQFAEPARLNNYPQTPPRTPTKVRHASMQRFGPHTIEVATPGSVQSLTRRTIDDPATLRAPSYVEFQRRPDGSAHFPVPPAWQALHGQPVCYEMMGPDGRIYNGFTERFPERAREYARYFNGKSQSAHGVADAFRRGESVYIGPKYISSSRASGLQNETGFTVLGETLTSQGGYNGNRGEGDPSIPFGSPLSDGRVGRVASRLIRPSVDYSSSFQTVMSGPYITPEKNIPVKFNKYTGSITAPIPSEFENLENVIYRFKVGSDQRYIGRARTAGRRLNQHLSAFNGGAGSDRALPVAVRTALEDEQPVQWGILGCTSTEEDAKYWEGHLVKTQKTRVKEGGLNMILPPKTDPETSQPPLYNPSMPRVGPRRLKRETLHSFPFETSEFPLASPESSPEKQEGVKKQRGRMGLAVVRKLDL